MITRLGLKNFRSWKELDIELAPITMFFGVNSSGKSNILYSLLALKQTVDSFDRGRSFNFGGTDRDYIDFGSYRDVVFGHDEKLPIGVELKWDAYPRNMETSYSVQWCFENDRVVIGKLEYVSPSQSFWMERQQPNQYDYKYNPPEWGAERDDLREGLEPPRYLPDPVSCYGIPRSHALIRASRLSHFFTRLMLQIAYLGPLRQYPKREYLWTGQAPSVIDPRGGGALEALIAAERRETPSRNNRKVHSDLFNSVLKWMKNLGLIKEFSIEAIDEGRRYHEPRVSVAGDDIPKSIVDVGFGISQVLPVVTQLFFVPEGSIVLLEQPELHLHPCAQSELADLFLAVAEERNLQLIIESHSEYLLTRLQRRIAEIEFEFATPEKIRLYFCEMSEEGSQIQPIKTNEYGEITNWPDNFFGDRVGDLQAMSEAGFARRREMIEGDASQSG